MGHTHEFELKAKTYSPPCPPDAAIRAPGVVLMALRCGVTQYAYMCRCGELKCFQLFGREERGVMEIKFTEVKKT